MKIKIHPFGWVNLLHLFLTLIAIALCLLIPIFELLSRYINLYHFISLLFVYPLIVHFAATYNRYIEVDGNKLTFQIDRKGGSLFRFPTFYQDEFSLKQLKYYGIFSSPFIRGYIKAPRGKEAKQLNKEVYDVLEVKEGNLKVPTGSIIVGNPLAFVFNKKQYVLDDYLFTREQYASLFRVIENNTSIAPSGAVKSAEENQETTGLTSSIMMIAASLIAVAFPFAFGYLISIFTKLPFTFKINDYLSTAFLTFFVLGNISLVIKIRSRVIKNTNYAVYDVMEFLANICLVIFYLIALGCFIFGYII